MSTDSSPFQAGAMVLITLSVPREKYWGAILGVSPAGVAVRGMELNSLEDFIRQVNAGDEVFPHSVFFPMHRVERMELDDRDGDIPSVRERFENKTGKRCSDFFEAARSGSAA